jgi:hypothetical protein
MARAILAPEQLHKESRALWEAIRGESPLACALICGAFLEKALASLLSSFFLKGETANKILDENRGALGDFFKRANAAYCCGLITKRMLQALLTIGTIRNTFAHSHTRIDFSDSSLDESFADFKLPNIPKKIGIGGDPQPLDLHDRRTKFSITCLYLFSTILHTASNIEHVPKIKNVQWPD